MRLSLFFSALLVVALVGCDASGPESSVAASVADADPWALPDGAVATAAPVISSVDDDTPLNVVTFDELPQQPADGVSLEGVTFAVSGGNAFFNRGGPTPGPFVQCPCLEGSTNATLTLEFDKPTDVVEFGVGLSAFGATLTPGFTAEVFGPSGKSRGVFEVDTAPAPGFTGALFRYDEAAVRSVVITFSNAAGRFAIDNLRYHVPPGLGA